MCSNSEVRVALFNIDNFKAKWLDEFQDIFYQNSWVIVEPALCSLVKEIFASPTKVKDLNEILITLVPKVEPIINMK